MRPTVQQHARWAEDSRRAARLLRDREVWSARAARVLVWSLTLGSLAGALRPLVRSHVLRGTVEPWAAGAVGLGIIAALFFRWWSDNRGQRLASTFNPGALAAIPLDPGDFALGMRARVDEAGIVLERPGGLGYALRSSAAVVVLGLFCLGAAVMVLATGLASPLLGAFALLGPVVAVVWLRRPRLLRIAVLHGDQGFTAEVRVLRWGVTPRTSRLTRGAGFIDEGPGVLLAAADDGSTLCLTDFGEDPWTQWEVRRLAATLGGMGYLIEADPGERR